eukprot:3654978-Amphidinium_carterae.1
MDNIALDANISRPQRYVVICSISSEEPHITFRKSEMHLYGRQDGRYVVYGAPLILAAHNHRMLQQEASAINARQILPSLMRNSSVARAHSCPLVKR